MTGPVDEQRAGPGGIGGAAGEAGAEYRRGVAAYIVACGLAGLPLLGFGPPSERARITSVALETDDVVDDIRVEFTSGFVSFVQAKRRLSKGSSFNKATAQWVQAVQQGLRPDRDRLVIVTGSMSGPMRVLGQALDRYKTDLPGGLTDAERGALDNLDAALDGLTADQREIVRKCALIHQLDVEESFLKQSREGILLLTRIVDAATAMEAWHALTRIAGRAARRRGGFTLEGWFDELQGEGIILSPSADSIAATLVRRSQEVDRYFAILRQRASHLDFRGLGGAIPPIPMAAVDANVRVLLDEDDSRSDADVLWAFLRRGRMVLTGLPGGGKSTVLAGIASRLSFLSDGPFPILASLASIDRDDHSLSFRERFLKTALKDLPEASRAYVREVIEERLETGDIALLLDSLDETYQRRADVVMELDRFLSTVSPDVNVLLATRDVAYAQAHTLGWPHLRLLSPQELEKTIEAIIRMGAETLFKEENPIDLAHESWVQTRKAWVADAMHADPLLRETPLLPVLLSLLAIEREKGALPTGRASVLRAVIDDVVRKREVGRGSSLRMGRLQNGEAARAALQAFALEGSTLIEAGGRMCLADLLPKIAALCMSDWGLTVGQADETGDALIRFWDESGIFVINGAEQIVAPRLLLFAEIGDALYAVGLSEHDVRSWVTASLERRSIEPVILAAGLSPVAADELVETAGRQSDRELLLAATRAISEGAVLSLERTLQVVAGLAADAAIGDYEGWQSWLAMVEMPVNLLGQDALRSAVEMYPAEHQVLANAMVDLRFRGVAEITADPGQLLAVLALRGLPSLPRRHDIGDRLRLESLGVDQSLDSTIVRSSGILLGAVSAATPLILDCLDNYSFRVHGELVQLLESRGFDDELEQERTRQRQFLATTLKMFEGFGPEDYRLLLEHLADRERALLTVSERTRLDELADFLETMNFNRMGTSISPKVDVRSLIELVARLGCFDLARVAAQAAVILRRIDETDGGHESFFALFDLATARSLDDWDAIVDKGAAVRLCLRILRWSYGSALVAGRVLYGAPIAELAAPKLRELLPKVASSESHVGLVAAVLCSLIDGPEPEVWVDDDDPFLRLAAARLCDPVTDARLSAEMNRLLQDRDGTVRDAAVKRLEKVIAIDRESALRRAIGTSEAGWTCLSCRTFNKSKMRGCAKEGCFRAKPNPSGEASKLLRITQA